MSEQYLLKRPEFMKDPKRVGRGTSAGQGKTCGRGQKGQLSRSGSKHRPWFEGGQMPLQRRIPKRGFKNFTKIEYQIINIKTLSMLSMSEITPEVLLEKGQISNSKKPIKILGGGELKTSVKVYADIFSESALAKIKQAGGEAIVRQRSNIKTS
jgi:large subunit ribosomal protein L15